VKENMFLIISLPQVASRGRGGNPNCCFKAIGVDTKSETSNTANDISRKVKKHVSGKHGRYNLLPIYHKNESSQVLSQQHLPLKQDVSPS
jgi:hypothetical protein